MARRTIEARPLTSYKTKQGYNSFLTAPDKEMLKNHKNTHLYFIKLNNM
jgi:hypothetical protein